MCQSRLSVFIAGLLCLALLSVLAAPKSLAMQFPTEAAGTTEVCPHHEASSQSDSAEHHQNSCQNCQLCTGLAALPSVVQFTTPHATQAHGQPAPNTYQDPDLGRLARPPNALS
jgi:hypothetical protein